MSVPNGVSRPTSARSVSRRSTSAMNTDGSNTSPSPNGKSTGKKSHLRNGYCKLDYGKPSPTKSSSPLSPEKRVQSPPQWSPSTKLDREKVPKYSLLKKDEHLEEKSTLPKQTSIKRQKRSTEEVPTTKVKKKEIAVAETNGYHENGTENLQNHQSLENGNLLQEPEVLVLVNDQTAADHDHVTQLRHQLDEAQKLLKMKDELLEVKDGQLKEAEMKLQNVTNGSYIGCNNTSEVAMLLERINQLEEKVSQSQELISGMTQQREKNMLSTFEQMAIHEKKNQEKMKVLMEHQTVQMKQLIMEQLSKTTAPNGKSECVSGADENNGNGLLIKRRDNIRQKDLCWNNHHNCLLNEQQFQFVGDQIAGDWKRLLRNLDVKEYRLDNIEENYANRSTAEKAVQGLVFWQRQTPNQAALCKLTECLKTIERQDIIEGLNFDPPDNDSPGFETYIASVDHYTGRVDEINQIRGFCDELHKDRLLYINGLPGIGKCEVLTKALSRIDRKFIVMPNFYDREDRMENWKYCEFIQCVKKAWELAFNKEVSNIKEELLNVRNLRILILEMAPFFAEAIVAHHIWRFIYDITRNSQSKLKVIVTTCKHPEEILTSFVPCLQIALRGLDQEMSISLLKQLNPNLSESHGKRIFNFFGGNPFFLLKISAWLNKFGNFEEDMFDLMKSISINSLQLDFVKRLVKRTDWAEKMVDVLDMMDENERVVLAKLCVFNGPIPKNLLTLIFGECETAHEARHLYAYHCFLELLPVRKMYFLSPIYRVFIKMYVKEDKRLYQTDGGETLLQSICSEAQKQVVKCYMKLLGSLTRMFFSNEDVNVDECCAKLISKYRKHCGTCVNGVCECANYLITREIFLAHKTMIISSLEETLRYDLSDFMFLVPVDIFLFLEHMSKEIDLKFQPINECEFKYFEDRDCVYLYYYRSLLKRSCEKRPLDLDFLNKSINKIEEKKSDAPSYQVVLFLLYLARAARLAPTGVKQSVIENDLAHAKKIYMVAGDIGNVALACSVKARVEKFSGFSIADPKTIDDLYSLPNFGCNGKYAYMETAADIAFRFDNYENSKKLWEVHFKFAYEQLGMDHPFTAGSFYHLGQCQERLNEPISQVIGNYEKAASLSSKLKLNDKAIEFYATLQAAKSRTSDPIEDIESPV